jgi:hypothetical protein
VVRTYVAKSQQEAAVQFQQDAVNMAAAGYYPINQIWTPGSWSSAAWIVGLILLIFLIGIFVLILLLVVKPDGTLTVTYDYRGQPQAQPSPQAPAIPAAESKSQPAAPPPTQGHEPT